MPDYRILVISIEAPVAAEMLAENAKILGSVDTYESINNVGEVLQIASSYNYTVIVVDQSNASALRHASIIAWRLAPMVFSYVMIGTPNNQPQEHTNFIVACNQYNHTVHHNNDEHVIQHIRMYKEKMMAPVQTRCCPFFCL